jgi:DNA-binding PadR family transcriptional regulator
MNYAEKTFPHGVLADLGGSSVQSAFYKLLLPLTGRLLTSTELEHGQSWMTIEGGKSMLVDYLLDRVNDRFSELESQKQMILEFNQTIAQLKAEIETRRVLGWEQHQEFCDVCDENDKLKKRIEKMKTEVEMCRKHPVIVEKTYTGTLELSQTIWMTEWRDSPGFDKQAVIVKIIGETGLGRVPVIRERAAALFGYKKPSAGGISKALAALEKRGLISIRQANGGMQGRPPKLTWLTDLGQAAYVMLTNHPPLRSELTTQASHVSDAHMLLNLEAADLLTQAGYEILAHGHRHFLGGVRQAVPDITARKDDTIIYIEVERSGKKSSRPEKWINLQELTDGNLYVFCQYEVSQEQIAEEVQKTLRERNLASRLTLTNLEALRSGRRGPAGSLWLEQINIFAGPK